MVERSSQLDLVFGSLSDPTRRDILRRVATQEMSVSAIALHYGMTVAAISKHVGVLARAHLITKRRQGKQQMIRLSPDAIVDADKHLQTYKELWEHRLDALEEYLRTIQ